VVEKSLRTTA